MAEALDAMPVKELISGELESYGQYCALGVVGKARGLTMDMANIDPEDYSLVAKTFGIATALAQEIMYENDESWDSETPAGRWTRMRQWVKEQIKP